MHHQDCSISALPPLTPLPTHPALHAHTAPCLPPLPPPPLTCLQCRWVAAVAAGREVARRVQQCLQLRNTRVVQLPRPPQPAASVRHKGRGAQVREQALVPLGQVRQGAQHAEDHAVTHGGGKAGEHLRGGGGTGIGDLRFRAYVFGSRV